MNILLLNTYDKGGGAEKVAYDLLNAYRDRGHNVKMLVRYKWTLDQSVSELNPYSGTYYWGRLCAKLESIIRRQPSFRGKFRFIDWLRRSAFPRRWIDHLTGVQFFNYPQLLNLLNKDWQPDVIHAHNLHGDYFDLRAFETLGVQVPIVWTLHDTWAITGHCAYFIECDRWLSGCGHCPDLKRLPAILADNTAQTYQAKKKTYESSNFSVATPSRWLMSQLEKSILKEKEKRVIPNGVDLAIFKRGDKQSARRALHLPDKAFICLYVSYYGAQTNPYKDYTTIAQTIELLAPKHPDLFFICIGGLARSVRQTHMLETGLIADPQTMALYYQASDVLLHAANAENFPCVILEAMACGTPVVATAVGGIPEQIENGATGFTVPKKDAEAMASHVLLLKKNPALQEHMSQKASHVLQKDYSLDMQVSRYLDWFHNLVNFKQHARL